MRIVFDHSLASTDGASIIDDQLCNLSAKRLPSRRSFINFLQSEKHQTLRCQQLSGLANRRCLHSAERRINHAASTTMHCTAPHSQQPAPRGQHGLPCAAPQPHATETQGMSGPCGDKKKSSIRQVAKWIACRAALPRTGNQNKDRTASDPAEVTMSFSCRVALALVDAGRSNSNEEFEFKTWRRRRRGKTGRQSGAAWPVVALRI